LAKLQGSVPLQLTAATLCAWTLLFPLRISHTPAFNVGRELVTNLSFFAIVAVAATFRPDRSLLRILAWCTTIAFCTLGIAGALAGLGIVPAPYRIAQPREMFGLVSPIPRNYGLNVPWDAVSLMLPLVLPLYVMTVLDRGQPSRHRRLAVIGLVASFLATVLVFQSREMLFEFLLAFMAALFLVCPRIMRILTPVAILVLGGALLSLIQFDVLSSTLRSQSDLKVLEVALQSPTALLMGVDENELFIDAADDAGYLRAISGDNAIHNTFLSNLANGGLFSFLCIVAAYTLMTKASIQAWRRERRSLENKSLLVATLLVLFVVSVEPVRADVVGNWLLMGLVLSRGSSGFRHVHCDVDVSDHRIPTFHIGEA
jgi:hypothetical protein